VPTRKTAALALLPWALLGAQPVAAQAADPAREEPEEVIVRGRRLADFRAELEAAQLRVYDLFNDLNSDDAFDVRCQTEDATGTRLRQQTCRPQVVDDISSDAGKAWVNGFKDACPGGMTQDCIFGNPGAASQARSAALAEEGREPTMQKRFAAEMARVVRDHPEMQQALLDYEAVALAYDEARTGRRRGVRAGAR
jgi:hypothetical protein